MLSTLIIQNVVLIDYLKIDIGSDFCALTGETGAGKSILLDALGLALGNRSEARLVRSGEDEASVSAIFEINNSLAKTIKRVLDEHGLAFESTLILRRNLKRDGRSKAFINDQPVSVSLLKKIGHFFVEIHGQFDTQDLLNPSTHRNILDQFSGLNSLAETVSDHWYEWQDKKQELAKLKENIARAIEDKDFLEHALQELEDLNPQHGEEEELASKRKFLANAEKLIDTINTAQKLIEGHKGSRDNLHSALKILERQAEQADKKFDPVIDSLNRAASEMEDGLSHLNDLAYEITINPNEQNALNERLFALRGLARKHGVTPNDLPELTHEFREKLTMINDQSDQIEKLEKAISETRQKYIEDATTLSQKRQKKANILAEKVMTELIPLKLDKARFVVSVNQKEENQWGIYGIDDISFMVSTNPGSEPGPLKKIASGGELARFMLAIKVITNDQNNVPTMIFDEVDTGIGGATADAVGERLAKLGNHSQVLAVTHSPQVAAWSKTQFKIAKLSTNTSTKTQVKTLSFDERIEEISRMLAGSMVTTEARAAAKTLLEKSRLDENEVSYG